MTKNGFGQLARQWAQKLLPLQVLQSAADYYVGTCDEDGPVSRESNEYFKNRETAEQALADGNWSQKAEP